MYKVILNKTLITNCATLDDANDLYGKLYLKANSLEIRDENNKILTKKL